MKRTATTVLAILCSVCAFSQNWLLTGNSGTNPASNFIGTTDNQRLVFRTNNTENMTVLTNGNVGIGTSSPALTLHIVSNTIDNFVRLQGASPSVQFLADISGVTQNGKLGFANSSGIYAPTAAAGDFIMANNYSSGNILFSTGGGEKMRLASNGNLGIGTTSPALPMHIVSNTIDNFVRLQGASPSVQFLSDISGVTQNGKLGFANASGIYAPTAVAGDFVLVNNYSAGNILFSSGGGEKMRLTSSGNVGIGTGSTAPTARLQVECAGRTSPSNVRLTNLQSGTGTTLVIDSNGYVYRSASGFAPSGAAAATPLTTELQSQVEELKNQVQELRSLLSSRLSLSQSESASLKAESTTFLGDNHPNPASGSTTIDYSLPQGASAAACQVYSLDGKLMTSVVLPGNAGKSQVQLNTGQFAAGIYMYSLIVNDKVVDTKKLVVSK